MFIYLRTKFNPTEGLSFCRVKHGGNQKCLGPDRKKDEKIILSMNQKHTDKVAISV
jgi:hypothetical protein